MSENDKVEIKEVKDCIYLIEETILSTLVMVHLITNILKGARYKFVSISIDSLFLNYIQCDFI